MPLCDSTDTQAHCDHVVLNQDMVGVKRKHKEDISHAMDLDQEPLTIKRQCREMCPDAEGDNGVVLSHTDHQQFMTPSQASSLSPAMSTPLGPGGDYQVYGCMKDVIGHGAPGDFTPVTLTPPHHPDPHASVMDGCRQGEGGRGEGVLWMDMDGETYCPLMSSMDVETAMISATPLH